MISRLLAVVAAGWAVAASAVEPAQFANGIGLQADSGRPLLELVLPDAVYAGAQRADLADLRRAAPAAATAAGRARAADRAGAGWRAAHARRRGGVEAGTQGAADAADRALGPARARRAAAAGDGAEPDATGTSMTATSLLSGLGFRRDDTRPLLPGGEALRIYVLDGATS